MQRGEGLFQHSPGTLVCGEGGGGKCGREGGRRREMCGREGGVWEEGGGRKCVGGRGRGVHGSEEGSGGRGECVGREDSEEVCKGAGMGGVGGVGGAEGTGIV